MKSLPQRKSPRLQGYDYAQAGVYFVTICTYQRLCLFGKVEDGVMVVSNMGQIAQEYLEQIPLHWSDSVVLDLFVVMPNHVHIILVLTDVLNQRTGQALSLPPLIRRDDACIVRETPIHDSIPTLGTVIGSYKSGVTRRIREQNGEANWQVWQGRYHDHIIRNPADLERIQQYILNNPACWTQDTFYEA